MNNQDFWHSIHSIIDEGFTANGFSKLESYAEQFTATDDRFYSDFYPRSFVSNYSKLNYIVFDFWTYVAISYQQSAISLVALG